MIRSANDILAIEGTLLPLEIFRPHMEMIADQGTKVFIKAHTNISIPKCSIICLDEMSITAKSMPFQFFNISNAGYEYTSALLNNNNTQFIDAINCGSKYLSFVAYSGISSEFSLTKLLADLYEGKSSKEIMKTWKSLEYMRPSKIASIQEYFV